MLVHPRGDVTVGWVMSAISMAVICVTTTAGNAVVMRAVRQAQRAPAHYPLASLAAADLLVGVSVLPLAAARELFVFQLPWPVCAFWSTMDVLCCTASILSICALGWERWCGITDPLARARRSRRAKVSAALIWPVSTVIALPTAFIPSQKHDIGPSKACTVNTNVSYVFTSISFSFYIPAGIMVFFYARILRSLASPPGIRADRGRTPGNALHGMNQTSNKVATKCNTPLPKAVVVKTFQSSPNTKLCTTPKGTHLGLPAGSTDAVPSPLKKSSSPGGIIPRQRRATRTIVRLMSLFLICWTPFFVMLPVDSLCECVNDVTWQWCTWLGYANSALNPLVYAAASPSVRRALRNSLTTSSSAFVTDVPLSSCVRRP